jgi:tripartite ATP-independent transporter DctM subunit
MIATAIVARMKGYQPERTTRVKFKDAIVIFFECIWAFLFPVLLIVGLRFGIFTPTEGGAFACVYAILVGIFAYREFTWKKLLKTLEGTVVDVGMVMILIALSSTFSYGIIWDQIPQRLAEMIFGLSQVPWVVMLIIIAFLLLAGTFMDSTVLILMLTSILLPIALRVGIDPVQFGIVFVLTLTVGLLSPPEGAVLYIICTIFKCSMWDFVKEGWPLLVAIVVVAVLVVFFPQVALWLPNTLYGK